ncbi:MAG TPA: glycosyltransferase family 1 protein [Bacillales bacterium]
MDGPKRILHAAVNMNRGGAETLIMNWYRNIDRTKVQFDFLTCKEGSFDAEIMEMGGMVHRIPYISNVGHFQYMKALDDFFSTHREYHAVHSHMDRMSGLVLRSARKADIPIRIAHSHNTKSEGGLAARGYKWYAGHFILKSASHLFACSGRASEWLYGKHASRATLLKNGVDCNRFRFSPETEKKVKEKLHLDPDGFIVGHIGRFHTQKNHSFLIESFAEIAKLYSNARLILIGDGPLKPTIEKKVVDLGLADKVKFLGVRHNVHELLQAFDVMVFPSIHEGLPVTLIEAQGVGVPCVISDAITDEADIGAGLIKYESIKNSPRTWAEKAIHMEKRRDEGPDFIKNKGFDIRTSASWLQDFYLNPVFRRNLADSMSNLSKIQ